MLSFVVESPQTAGSENHEFALGSLVGDLLPTLEIAIADIQHPPQGHPPDQLAWRRSDQGSTALGADRELEQQIGFRNWSLLDLDLSWNVAMAPDRELHHGLAGRARCRNTGSNTNVSPDLTRLDHPDQSIGERRPLSAREAALDDHEEVDVASRSGESASDKGAMHDDRGESASQLCLTDGAQLVDNAQRLINRGALLRHAPRLPTMRLRCQRFAAPQRGATQQHDSSDRS